VAERIRDIAQRLKEQGIPGKDMAVVLGVSPQRISQLFRKRRISK
jgi:hypothetical protein